MRSSQEIEDNLHRVECLKRNLNKKCIPIAHCTIPETWKFKCLEFAALITLRADEAGIFIYILEKVEAFTLIVMKTAYDIYRIEVGCRCESITCMIV